MRELIFPVEHHSETGLQTQLRRQLVDAILDGRLTTDDPLPSCRRLARSLGVSRNTVVLAYQALADEGLLLSRERVGYFVNPDFVSDPVEEGPPAGQAAPNGRAVDWVRSLKTHPSEETSLSKPRNWRRYPFPFIYGQADPNLFPVAAWRLCSRQGLGVQAIESWSEDSFGEDDAMLIEEVRTHILPRRGIKAAPDEILMTLGAQNALFLIASLLTGPGSTVGLEDPGYPDARGIFSLIGGQMRPVPIDDGGLVVGDALAGCDCVYATPSHQSPTTVTMPLERRRALLEAADREDFLIIEDDYEAEINFVSHPTTALKSMDRSGRVIYVGSLSKSLAPGLRIGFLVAPEPLIREARQLRRLMLRQPPTNNQRTVALFIAGGYYDALVARLQRTYRERWEVMGAALEKHLPQMTSTPSFGGTSFWVKGPDGLDADALARRALQEGILIEPGSPHFLAAEPPRNYFRLGFSSIPVKKIVPGIEGLATLLQQAS